MLKHVHDIIGYRLKAQDGQVGTVKDILFDDVEWRSRYFVIDTGTWLPGRQVLISPRAVESPDWEQHHLSTKLTTQSVEDSPPIASNRPVSRQEEAKLSEYFSWPLYWSGITGTAGMGVPPVESETLFEDFEQARREAEASTPRSDPHLRSAKEVTGYSIAARDGKIGHIEDLIVDPVNWSIRFVIVDTRDWLPGRKVPLSPRWFERFDWSTHSAVCDLPKQVIENAPAFDPSKTLDRELADEIYGYYGDHGLWTKVKPDLDHVR